MPKPKQYEPWQKELALAFLERLGDPKEAAKKAKVDEHTLRFWAGGGDENALDLAPAPTLSDFERPVPADALCDPVRAPLLIRPAPEVEAWAQRMFIAEDAAFCEERHWHLRDAKILFLWINVENARGGRQIAGNARLGPGGGADPWSTACKDLQLVGWYGGALPDFVITLDAVVCAVLDLPTFCALVEHELHHCAIKIKDGEPCFTREGLPVYTMRPHDVEAFIPVTERYGVGAAEAGVAALVEAAKRRPLIGSADLEKVCCGRCPG